MMGVVVLRALRWGLPLLLAGVAAACARADRPYWDIRPVHHVRNSPVPVPYPAAKPAPPEAARAPRAGRRVDPAVKPERERDSGAQTVTVEDGDSVYAIARAHGVAVEDFIALNRLEPPYTLRVGQRLKLPAPHRHVVKRGETAFSIAQRHDVALSRLAEANDLGEPGALRPGMSLKIPSSTEAEVSVASRESGSLPDPPARSGAALDWPVAGVVVSDYGPKEGGLRNDGVNIAAPQDAPVRAAEAGVVAYAGSGVEGFGRLLLLRHGGDLVTAYAHNAELLVERGEQVSRGEVIAKLGTSGRVADPQLHFEVRRGTEAIDPTEVLPRRSARAR